MKRFTVIALALGFVGILGFSQVSEVVAGDACARKEFKTELVKKACNDGGVKAAKDAMKEFLKTAKKAEPKITKCESCHTKLKDGFPLTDNGLELFKAAGGK